MQQKMSLVLPYEFEIVFKSLPPAEAGRLILAIYAYEQRNETPDFSDNQMLMFAWNTHIKPKIDENIDKYTAICEARRSAGSKGGKATQKNQNEANQANASFDKQNNQMQTNQADYDCDYDCDCDYESNNNNTNVLYVHPADDEPTKQEEYQTILDAWNSLPVTSIKSIRGTRLKLLRTRIKENGFDDVLNAISMVKHSPFLLGQNNRGWQITFDWFIKPNNFIKVLEGSYDERQRNAPTGKNDVVNGYRRMMEILGGEKDG